ncbi:MAG: EAL domain-containing protein [Acidobacteriota bacterium]
MSMANFSILASYALQALVGLLLAATLVAFYRVYGRRHLLLWAWSWLALAVYFLTAGASFHLAIFRVLATDHVVRLLLVFVSLAAALAQATTLVLGARELTGGRRPSRKAVVAVLAGLTFLATLATLAWSSTEGTGAERYFVRVGLRCLLTGSAFLIAGVGIWSHRDARGMGPRLLGGALLLYGFQQVHYFALAVVRLLATRDFFYPAYLGFVDLLLQIVMGMGMLIWQLEEERIKTLRATDRIDYLTNYDRLTGLPNRLLFDQRLELALERCRTEGTRLAVIVVDLDRFGVINTSFGHSFGDEVLRLLGQRLAAECRPGDVVARVGLDEFGVLLTRLANPADHGERVAHMLASTRRPFLLQRREVLVTASAGVALFPEHGKDPLTLVQHAEAAMQTVQTTRRDGFAEYDPAMVGIAPERYSLEAEVRKALERGEFCLHFQPIVSARDGRMAGVEALIRWKHVERGVLPPREFLGVAEALGILDAVESWVLTTACRQMRAWDDQHLSPLRMSVNLSAHRFQRPELAQRVQALIAEVGLAPERLVVEITENAAMEQAEATQRTLRELRDIGVGIAIDDFGTGYSSLAYLSTLPVSELKLDRSFVQNLINNPDNEAIVAAVVALAHGLGMPVVAEGVETEDQRVTLVRLGCDFIQGYLVARPMPAEAFSRFMASAASERA